MKQKTYNYEHPYPFEAFITNLGKYNEGDLVGKWLPLPATEENIKKSLEEIGIDEHYEEYFITDYDCYIDNIYRCLPEYTSIEALNELAEEIENMDAWDFEKFTAVLDYEAPSNVEDIIDLINNLNNYDFIEDVTNDYDLGYYYIEEAGIYDLSNMGNLSNYIDYERFGRDVRLEEGGYFTDNGYITSY